jgi:RNA polymerase-binding protein DksA
VALTRTQTKKLRDELNRLHAALLEEVRDELEASENEQMAELLGRTPADSADFSFADALADLNVAMVDRHVHQLRDIEAARQRIGAGHFGICIDCGTEVDFDRLMAYPTAKRCLRCQQQRERLYAHESTPKM